MKISVDQEMFIQNVLRRFRLEDCKPIITPAEMNLKLEKRSESSSDIGVLAFRSLVGSSFMCQNKQDLMSRGLQISYHVIWKTLRRNI